MIGHLVVFLFVSVFAGHYHRELYEGDDCELSYDEKGICVRLSLCPSAIEIVQRKEHPKRCGFVGSIPIVCCPKTQAIITRLAEQKCKLFQIPLLSGTIQPHPSNTQETGNKPFLPNFPPENSQRQNPEFRTNDGTSTNINGYPGIQQTYGSPYPGENKPVVQNSNNPGLNHKMQNKLHRQGQTPPLQHSPSLTSRQKIDDEKDSEFHQFVVGGTNALIREFPHMAALGYTTGNKIVWLCGGSLVSEQYVLTAAHCLFSKDFGQLQWVRLGELNLASTIDQSDPLDYRVIEKIPHPLYKTPSVYHDIALVKLDREIVITSYIKPACLFIQEYIPNGFQLSATGWGLTNVGGNKSDILQKVELDLFTKDECDQAYKNIAATRRLKNGILHTQQLCVGGRSQEKDTCQGDSGGPLQIQLNDQDGNRFYIVGITSFGRSCGIPNFPGIYTRVSYYVPWIESVLWPNEKY